MVQINVKHHTYYLYVVTYTPACDHTWFKRTFFVHSLYFSQIYYKDISWLGESEVLKQVRSTVCHQI